MFHVHILRLALSISPISQELFESADLANDALPVKKEATLPYCKFCVPILKVEK
jgi:hypothetical protein